MTDWLPSWRCVSLLIEQLSDWLSIMLRTYQLSDRVADWLTALLIDALTYLAFSYELLSNWLNNRLIEKLIQQLDWSAYLLADWLKAN